MCLGHTPGVYFSRLIDSHMAIRMNSTVLAKLTFSTIVFDPLKSTRNRFQCSFSCSGCMLQYPQSTQKEAELSNKYIGPKHFVLKLGYFNSYIIRNRY